jgi:AraC family carnitine catabolism transcriptional activator
MAPQPGSEGPRQFHFVLLPQFSFLGFGSTIEPLRVTNRFRQNAYAWTIVSLDGQPVAASNGMTLQVGGGLDLLADAQCIVIVAGFDPLSAIGRPQGKALQDALRQAERRGATLGAIDTGAFVLANSKLLGAGKITLHWEARESFAEMFPHTQVSDELFEISSRRLYCAGGIAGLDMMLALITQHYNHALAAQVSEQFVLERMRKPSDHQRMQTISRYKVHNEKLVNAIQLMERHVERPLTLYTLADKVGVSRRQLERLYTDHLHQSPADFYTSLRLARAQQLLEQTPLPIFSIAMQCGFASGAHFSRAFKRLTSFSPSSFRQAQAR